MRRFLVPALAAALAGCATTRSADVGAADGDVPGGPETVDAPPGLPPVVQPGAPCVDGMSRPAPLEAGAEADGPYACRGVGLYAHVPLSAMGAPRSANDVWGWTDPQPAADGVQHEYALVGLSDGTFFVDVTNPNAPVLLGKLPTATVATTWRDIKVYRDHAFVVSEARGHGMQVFSLARLRGLTADPARTFEADARYTGVTNVHNIVINEDTGFAYAVGATSRGENLPPACAAPGFHAVNIQDPLNPTFAACFSDVDKDASPVTAPGYTHDAQCVVYDGPDADYTGREVCVASNEDVVTFFDVTDKANVRTISQAAYPDDAYTHQGWFTEDRRYVIANDELDEQTGLVAHQRSLVFDAQDLDNPEFLFAYDSGLASIDHNLYIRDGLAYQSNYQSGLRIVDTRTIPQGRMEEVAFFDTYPQGAAAQFDGQWSNYPYFRSGTVVATDISNGLFVLRPDVLQASRRGAGAAVGMAPSR